MVVLPAPEWPTIDTNSLGFMVNDTSDNAVVLLGYVLDTLSKYIIFYQFDSETVPESDISEAAEAENIGNF
jgi:hypothetical protein